MANLRLGSRCRESNETAPLQAQDMLPSLTHVRLDRLSASLPARGRVMEPVFGKEDRQIEEREGRSGEGQFTSTPRAAWVEEFQISNSSLGLLNPNTRNTKQPGKNLHMEAGCCLPFPILAFQTMLRIQSCRSAFAPSNGWGKAWCWVCGKTWPDTASFPLGFPLRPPENSGSPELVV